jgi:hypothetical protein
MMIIRRGVQNRIGQKQLVSRISFPAQQRFPRLVWIVVLATLVLSLSATILLAWRLIYRRHHPFYSGPYQLVEHQQGHDLFNYYTFRTGPDSIGSDGFNTYVSFKRAQQLGIVDVKQDKKDGQQYVYMMSAPAPLGNKTNNISDNKRESIRLEGKRRFDKGLFILDVVHIPAGCGVWPAFWLTDERVWPDHGEIDILESINAQTVAKTALHTGKECSMYGYVSEYDKTGIWDNATQIPKAISGDSNNISIVESDNCWVKAPHQWRNQGCVDVSSENGTIGAPLDKDGGGVYVLEWDPVHGYIKSWIFKRSRIPANLKAAIQTAGQKAKFRSAPEPDHWERPYAYFAIGPNTGCSADHFRSMQRIFDLAFCGKVSGAKFAQDCPDLANEYSTTTSSSSSSLSSANTETIDPIAACNAYIASNPKALKDAYWKVSGVYVYQRQ